MQARSAPQGGPSRMAPTRPYLCLACGRTLCLCPVTESQVGGRDHLGQEAMKE